MNESSKELKIPPAYYCLKIDKPCQHTEHPQGQRCCTSSQKINRMFNESPKLRCYGPILPKLGVKTPEDLELVDEKMLTEFGLLPIEARKFYLALREAYLRRCKELEFVPKFHEYSVEDYYKRHRWLTIFVYVSMFIVFVSTWLIIYICSIEIAYGNMGSSYNIFRLTDSDCLWLNDWLMESVCKAGVLSLIWGYLFGFCLSIYENRTKAYVHRAFHECFSITRGFKAM